MLRLGAPPHVGDEADRRPAQNKNKKQSKNSSISEEAGEFSPRCCQEMNKWLSMLGGQISHLPARFSQLIPFSPYKAGNEISLSAVSPRAPPPPPLTHRHLYLFIRISSAEGKRKEPPLHLQKEKLSGAITQRAHQG